MQDLRLIGVHEDGAHLLLADDDGRRYLLALDEGLRAATRRKSGDDADPRRPRLSAREVQSLIRAGHSTEDVAEQAGWTIAKVEIFQAPILAERAHVAGLARASRLRTRGDGADESLTTRVEHRLRARGVEPAGAEWDASRDSQGEWQVHVEFTAGGRERRASWRFDPGAGLVEAADDEARWLSEDEATTGPIPAPHRFGGDGVFDVEATGGVAAAPVLGEPEPRSDQTDALMTAIRAHSHAGDRRGRRSRRRAGGPAPVEQQPEQPTPSGGLVGADELPLEHMPAVELPKPGAATSPPDQDLPPAARGPHPLDALPLEPDTESADTDTDVAAVPADSVPPADLEDADDLDETAAADQTDAPDAGDAAKADDETTAGDETETEADEAWATGEADAAQERHSDDVPADSGLASAPAKPPPGRKGRPSVPDWNDVMFGPSRGQKP